MFGFDMCNMAVQLLVKPHFGTLFGTVWGLFRWTDVYVLTLYAICRDLQRLIVYKINTNRGKSSM